MCCQCSWTLQVTCIRRCAFNHTRTNDALHARTHGHLRTPVTVARLAVGKHCRSMLIGLGTRSRKMPGTPRGPLFCLVVTTSQPTVSKLNFTSCAGGLTPYCRHDTVAPMGAPAIARCTRYSLPRLPSCAAIACCMQCAPRLPPTPQTAPTTIALPPASWAMCVWQPAMTATLDHLRLPKLPAAAQGHGDPSRALALRVRGVCSVNQPSTIGVNM